MRLYKDKGFGERREAAAKAKDAALKKFVEKARAGGKAKPDGETDAGAPDDQSKAEAAK